MNTLGVEKVTPAPDAIAAMVGMESVTIEPETATTVVPGAIPVPYTDCPTAPAVPTTNCVAASEAAAEVVVDAVAEYRDTAVPAIAGVAAEYS